MVILRGLDAVRSCWSARTGEILNLAIPKVDLKEGFIRERPEETKTSKRRFIPPHPEMKEALKTAMKVRHLTSELVFHRDGQPTTPHDVRVAHEAELKTLILSIDTPVDTTAKTENKKEVSANV
jgi:integrase